MEDTATNPGAVALSALLPSIPWQMTLCLLHENQKRSLQMDEAKRQISDAKDLPNEFQIRIQIESRYLNVLLIELVPSVTVFF